MKNQGLVKDYLIRCQNRLAALEVLYKRKSWPDVVRESQEIVELALKALLRACNIEVPRIHDVSDIILKQKDRMPKPLKPHLKAISQISRQLRRDRELAFYGSEDLTPSQFYKREDAKKAKTQATSVVKWITSLKLF